MSMQTRDKRALALMALAVAGYFAIDRLWTPGTTPVVSAGNSIESAERRLARLRQIAGTIEGKQQVLDLVRAELAAREKAVLQADTAAQAQMQLLEIARRTARAVPQAIEFGSVELGQQVAPMGENYGEVFVTVNFNCRIDDLVNYLAELTAQPELVGTRELRVYPRDEKQKTIGVRLALSGVVPRKLVPEKRGVF